MTQGGEKKPLSERFDRALVFAAQLHARQFRKGGSIPYISHLMIVAGTVLDAGGTEDEAIAALLHDAKEDQGGAETVERIRDLFGDNVVTIIEECSEARGGLWHSWRNRKETYCRHLAQASASAQLVALADKLHNARATLRDLQRHGASVWSRFNAGRDEQLWWYDSLAEFFRGSNCDPLLVAELSEIAELLHRV